VCGRGRAPGIGIGGFECTAVFDEMSSEYRREKRRLGVGRGNENLRCSKKVLLRSGKMRMKRRCGKPWTLGLDWEKRSLVFDVRGAGGRRTLMSWTGQRYSFRRRRRWTSGRRRENCCVPMSGVVLWAFLCSRMSFCLMS
jgi:hypothetical protein